MLITVYRLALLALASQVIALAGCTIIPISKAPADLVDVPALDGLIGKNKNTVMETLGPPQITLGGDKESYLIYGGLGDTRDITVFIIPFPVGIGTTPEGGDLFCVLLEFDEEKILRDYNVDQIDTSWFYGKRMSSVSKCALAFFTPGELEPLTRGDAKMAAFLSQELHTKECDRKSRIYQNPEITGAKDAEVAEFYTSNSLFDGTSALHIQHWDPEGKPDRRFPVFDFWRDRDDNARHCNRIRLLPGMYLVAWRDLHVSSRWEESFLFEAEPGHTYRLVSETDTVWLKPIRSDGLVCRPRLGQPSGWFVVGWLKDETTGKVVPRTRKAQCLR